MTVGLLFYLLVYNGVGEASTTQDMGWRRMANIEQTEELT
jgi:hypothetical protein